MDVAKNVVEDAVEGAKDFVEDAVDVAKNVAENVVEGAKDLLVDFVDTVVDVAGDFKKFVVKVAVAAAEGEF